MSRRKKNEIPAEEHMLNYFAPDWISDTISLGDALLEMDRRVRVERGALGGASYQAKQGFCSCETCMMGRYEIMQYLNIRTNELTCPNDYVHRRFCEKHQHYWTNINDQIKECEICLNGGMIRGYDPGASQGMSVMAYCFKCRGFYRPDHPHVCGGPPEGAAP